MSTILHLSESVAAREVIGWFRELRQRHFGFLKTPEGEQYVVMRPEQLTELDVILSDPAFLAALEAGVTDAAHGRTMTVHPGESLRHSLDGAMPCDASMAEAIERGVADAKAGRTQSLQAGQPLRKLTGMRPD